VIADATRPDNPLVYVNEGFTRATGYAADEVLGENCRFLQGEATDAESVDLLRERIAAGEPATVELVNYRKDGTPFWNQVQVSPVENDAGELTHYLGFQNDVTDRKRTEQLIRLLNRVLRHNLRNDVNVILGFADAIQGASGDDAERFGGYIRDTAETLIDLSERARDLQRFAGRQRDPRRLDPGSVLKSVADAHRDRFPAATVDLRIGTDRGLCAGPEVERAVSELVENALKHNPAPAPWVGIEVIDDGAWLELTVADDGPGIGETEVAPIASGRETTLDHGSGLGLWLVNWVVTRYGGSFQLRAEGEDGGGDGDGGTVATVRLPGIDPDAPVEEAARPSTVLFR
jgi:PAS domain S-box-containing protein